MAVPSTLLRFVGGASDSMERLRRVKWRLYGSPLCGKAPSLLYAEGALPVDAAAIALFSDSHLRHLPKLNEQLRWSGPSMFHVKRGRASAPCPIERQAGRAPR